MSSEIGIRRPSRTLICERQPWNKKERLLNEGEIRGAFKVRGRVSAGAGASHRGQTDTEGD